MKIFVLLILVLLMPFFLFAEKWVGRATVTNKVDGTKTASGEIYKTELLTGACNGFKIGADVVVINVKTKKSVKIKINDRLPNSSNFFMAISLQAAKEIELDNKSELIVVEADFSDINSTERLNVNGLVREGEIDEETLKNFPFINWPLVDKNKQIKDETTDIIKINDVDPNFDSEKMYPNKKDVFAKGDQDQDVFQKQKDKNKIFPEIEENLEPKLVLKENKINNDDDIFKAIKNIDNHVESNTPEIEELVGPNNKKNEMFMDYDNDIFNKSKTVEFVENKNYPEKEDKIKLPEQKDIKKIDIDQTDKKTKITKTDNIETKKTYTWVKVLEKNKLYVRFSTTFDKVEGDRRLELFNQLFSNVVGLDKDGRYVLLIGPVEEKDIDTVINAIRKFGYKDSYVIKG